MILTLGVFTVPDTSSPVSGSIQGVLLIASFARLLEGGRKGRSSVFARAGMPREVMPSTVKPSSLSDVAPLGGLVLLGGGGHAVVVAEAALLAGVVIAGFLDDHPAPPLAAILIDVPRPFETPAHLGPLAGLVMLGAVPWVLALGDLRTRRGLLRSARESAGAGAGALLARARSVIHPTAIVSPTASIGPGAFIGPGAIVHARAKVGAHATVNSGAIVEHDCTIDENAHVAPGAVLGGGCHVGADALVGLGSRLLPGVSIGAGATVGAGAVVLEAVREGAMVVGVPARVV